MRNLSLWLTKRIIMPPVGKDEQSDALRQAARTNDVDKLKSLLAKGADANTASVRLAGGVRKHSLRPRPCSLLTTLSTDSPAASAAPLRARVFGCACVRACLRFCVRACAHVFTRVSFSFACNRIPSRRCDWQACMATRKARRYCLKMELATICYPRPREAILRQWKS